MSLFSNSSGATLSSAERALTSVSGVCELTLLRSEAIRFELTLDQIAPRDLGLLGFRVAGKLDHFHPVTQWTWNRVEHVRRADEHHLRQIERHGEIVVAKGRVLLR